MKNSNYVYVASCVFTREYPELSVKIQDYLIKNFNIPIMRCCVPKYKLKEFTNSMPHWLQNRWDNTPDFLNIAPYQTVICICHNCSAIFEEYRPNIKTISLWEFILNDDNFKFPNYYNEKITLQDCWRSHDNYVEQEAVRSLLRKMNIDIIELKYNHEKTQFCGDSLYKTAPPRNLKLAPKRFIENAHGKFIPHSPEERIELMKKYCNDIPTEKVIAYCHYCVNGLKLGGKQGIHLAELLFKTY